MAQAKVKFRFDAERFLLEVRRLGCDSVADVAHLSGVSARTVRRTISGAERPDRSLLLWMVEHGLDVRKVWVDA